MIKDSTLVQLRASIDEAWHIVSPVWPLQHFIARNPLSFFEDLHFKDALTQGFSSFDHAGFSAGMQAVNRETIKWCQAFFDTGEAAFMMPLRHKGLYASWKALAPYDDHLHGRNSEQRALLRQLPEEPEDAIVQSLQRLGIPVSNSTAVFKFMLTTLSGWAGYVKYCVIATRAGIAPQHSATFADFLALRLVIASLLSPQIARMLNDDSSRRAGTEDIDTYVRALENAERQYRDSLMNMLQHNKTQMYGLQRSNDLPEAQLLFCVDVRSEPLRRALEAEGVYDTFGIAGFFGVPVRVQECNSRRPELSCPLSLASDYVVKEQVCCSEHGCSQEGSMREILLQLSTLGEKAVSSSIVSCFIIGLLGWFFGVLMALKTLLPQTAITLRDVCKQLLMPQVEIAPLLFGIPFPDQCAYAEKALRMVGLIADFAPLVVLCGHRGSSENNTYASALDCGACCARPGGFNARILAAILNSMPVREELTKKGIHIPDDTCFLAAEHTTTTNEVQIFGTFQLAQNLVPRVAKLSAALQRARSAIAASQGTARDLCEHAGARSVNWAEVSPERALARNASCIIAPRALTQGCDLEGRAFLHSYEWSQDHDACLLEDILTGPLMVGYAINTHYLFAAFDQGLYGGGSKTTQNIVDKIGVMQGNASDLMYGVSSQSLYSKDHQDYRDPVRLLVLVYAPRRCVEKILNKQERLKNLVTHAWLSLLVMDPRDDDRVYTMGVDGVWRQEG